MLKLRNILLHNTIFIIILLISIIISTIRIVFVPSKNINSIKLPLTSNISSYYIDGNKLTITMSKYNIKANYYIKSYEEKKYLENTLKVGDIYKITGDISKPSIPTTKGLFNYRNYLKTKKIYFIVTIKSIHKVTNTHNSYYLLKNFLQKHLNKSPYLYTFILGDKSYLSEDAIYSYQENGISHLFAISGMHITLLSSIIDKLLKKLKLNENKRFLIITLFLLLYLILVGFSPSILRGVLFYILFSLNKIYYFYIKSINLYFASLAITLIINPFYIYDTGFLFSYTISLALLLSNNYLKSNNYFISLIKTSFVSFICSLPISLYNYCSINILSIVYNLLFVPIISIIIFPLSLITLIIPILIKPYNILTNLIEIISINLSKISITKLIFKRLNIIYYLFLLIFIFYFLKKQNKNNKNYFKYLIPILIIHYLIPYFTNNSFLKMIDVGQGDSILLHSNNKVILVDTGGITTYKNFKWQQSNKEFSIVKNITIPILKQEGLKRIDYLILTHGDYDHLGEALNLIKYFKVDNVIINCNEINYLEEEIIRKANKVIIGEEGLTLNIGGFNLIQLNEDLKDENDSSQIYLVKYNDIKILLTGDASVKSEKNMLKKYDIGKVDILKVGHHGSKTSTSDELLKTINPNLALISLGKNNKFHHPNKETLEKLNSYQIPYFRTDILGTISINLDTKTIS